MGYSKALYRACLAVAMTAAGANAFAELTIGGNLRLREDDFDLQAFEAGNRFGWALATCDFDGDGRQDLAIGSPFADVLGFVDEAGLVHVAYGSTNGLSLQGHQTLTQPVAGPDPPEQDDHFGSSLAGGDFDDDGYCDLAVGAPGEEVDGEDWAGSVHVFSGSANGLETTSQVWTQNEPGVIDTSEAGDQFGDVLAAGDFNNDGHDDLVISVTGEDVAAGAIHVLLGTAGGLTTAGNDFIYQGDPLGTSGTSQAFDRFGEALAVGYFDDDNFADLAVGAPFEHSAGISNVGWVHIFYGEALALAGRDELHLDQTSVGESLEDGDEFGWSLSAADFNADGFDDLAIGSPGEGVGMPGAEDDRAGSVIVLAGTPAGLTTIGAQLWTQDSAGVSDDVEPGDHFGYALEASDFDGDGRDDLAIGATGEHLGSSDNGAVHALYGFHAGLSAEREQFRGQGGWNLGSADPDDHFGSPLASGDFDGDGVWELVVGVPDEDLQGDADTGLVGVITSRFRFADGFESGDLRAWSAAEP